MRSGATDLDEYYLEKPFTSRDLLSKVKEALNG